MPGRIGDPNKRRRHFIKEWRKFRGLTQEQLAEILDTTKASISRIESLDQGYTQDFLDACADALGTHPGTLLMRGPSAADKDLIAPVNIKERRFVGGQRLAGKR
jgi:transcriptional regulator with XRE-family HTH domain